MILTLHSPHIIVYTYVIETVDMSWDKCAQCFFVPLVTL